MQSIMKKIRKYGIILFAGLCACAAWSCEEDKTDRKFTPKDPVIKLGVNISNVLENVFPRALVTNIFFA